MIVTKTKAVIPEFADYYARTGGMATWGPCLTNGFFVAVSADGRLRESTRTAPGAFYIQVCANGALSHNAAMSETAFAVEPYIVSQWHRSGGGPLLGIEPAAPPDPTGQYFLVTGHSVVGPFLDAFIRLGGGPVVGLPITEPFHDVPGYTSQYFQRFKLRVLDATGEVFIEQLGRNFLVMLTVNRSTAA